MVPLETLKAHYAEYAAQPDSWVENMEKTKRSIVEKVLVAFPLRGYRGQLVRVAVLGASDPRYLAIHSKIFAHVLGPVNVRTLDTDVEHLGSRADIVRHDVTTPFPVGPFHIVFSHELLKFLHAMEQWQCLENSYTALSPGGISMHVVHEPAIKGTAELRPWQYRVAPRSLVRHARAKGIPANIFEFESDSSESWLRPTTVIIIRKK